MAGKTRCTHEEGAERRRAIVRAMAAGAETVEELAGATWVSAPHIDSALYSMIYHFRVAHVFTRSRRGVCARYRLTMPPDAAIEIMCGSDLTTARDGFAALEAALPMPGEIRAVLGCGISPRTGRGACSRDDDGQMGRPKTAKMPAKASETAQERTPA